MNIIDIEKAISIIEEDIRIHTNWMEWQEEMPDWEQHEAMAVKIVGGPEHHREWIEKYESVRDLLVGLKEKQ